MGAIYMRTFLAAALLLLLYPQTTLAKPASLGDFNGDGRSDLSVALVNRQENSTAWLTRANAEDWRFWTWDVAADAFVSGNFFGDGQYHPGIVRVINLETPLEWRIKLPNGNADVAFYYGLPGDGIPNQADIDCDGVTDAVVTRDGTADYYPGFKLWYMAPSTEPGTFKEQVWGFQGDYTALADMDGDNCAELVVLRDGYLWYTLNPRDGSFDVTQWGLNGDLPLLPSDVNGDGKADYIITRRTGVYQVAYVRFGDGPNDWTTYQLGFDSSIPQVGNFLGETFFAWSQRDIGWVALAGVDLTGGVGALFPFGIEANHIIRPDGTVVAPDSDGIWPSTGGDGGGGTSCTRTLDFVDGPGNALYKQVSEVTGRPVILLPGEYWEGDKGVNKIEVLSSTGEIVASGSRRTCCPNGGRAHFDISSSGSALAQYAPITIKFYQNNGDRECRTVDDPTRRYD